MLAKYVEKKTETCSTMKEFNLTQLQESPKKVAEKCSQYFKAKLNIEI